MKTAGILILSAILASAAWANSDDGIDEQTIASIEAKLAEMECQMDPDDIEAEDEGYELDDVICKGGDQFDIVLDKDLNEVSRKGE